MEKIGAPCHWVSTDFGDDFGPWQVELMNNIMITQSSTQVLEIYYPCIILQFSPSTRRFKICRFLRAFN